jgi:two-component system, OmpR family, sensor histidine kinase TctE
MTSSTANWSLVRRLAWRLSAVMIVAVGLAAAAVAWRTLATIRSIDGTALQSEARLVAGRLEPGADGRPILHLPAELEATFSRADERSLFIVYDAENHPLLSSDPNAVPAVTASLLPPPWTGFFRTPPTNAYPEGLVGVLIRSGNWRVVVAQARELNEGLFRSLLREFLESALWLLLPIGGITVLIGVLTLYHGLRPLHEASAAAGHVGPGQIGVRLPSAGLPAELTPLVGAVNAALGRLEAALDSQRRFVAEAAHALRTPLAVLTARIDELSDQSQAVELRADADRLARLIGQMLTMERLEEIPLDLTGQVDLHRVAVEVISELAPIAISRRIELALREPDLALPPVPGNAAAVSLALSNLLDNALRHAPPGTLVEVTLAPPATLVVSDRGPGVPEAERERIFDRFHRSPGSRSGGAGLGLAIVAGIAAAHRGAAWVEPRPGGGAVFVLQIGPRSARQQDWRDALQSSRVNAETG